MEIKEFKKIFTELARQNGFKTMRDGWLKESPECIVTLDLQKNPYAKFYYLNIKMFIQRIFGDHYSADDESLIKNGVGYLLRRGCLECKDIFDLSNSTDDVERAQKLKEFFDDFLIKFVEKALTINGLLKLAESGQVFMTDETKQELIRFETAV